MTSKHSVLSTKRQKSLAELDKACRHHRGVGAARHAAVRDTMLLLRAEVKARDKAQAKARRQQRSPSPSNSSPDLFQGLH